MALTSQTEGLRDDAYQHSFANGMYLKKIKYKLLVKVM